MEYEWFVDFAMYAMDFAVFSLGGGPFTEAYSFVVGPSQETTITVRAPAYSGLLFETQWTGEWDPGLSFTVPLRCYLWNHLLCYKYALESVLCSPTGLELLHAAVTGVQHHTAP